MRRAQVSLEFIVVASMVAGGFILASSAIFEFIEEGRSNQEVAALKEIGSLLFSEVLLASNVQDQYTRYFTLPATADGMEYEIIINKYDPPRSNNSEVVFRFPPHVDNGGYERVVFLHDVRAKSLQPGCNRIVKEKGIITLTESTASACS